MQVSETVHAANELLAANPIDPKYLVTTFGLFGIWAILFAETGLLLGFFLPGDSLLFLAGIATSATGGTIVGATLSLPGMLIGGPICAIAGAQFGHFLGARYGRKLFDRPNSRLFKGIYVEKAEQAFVKFGPAKAVVFARFIPIVRTFLNPVAGMLGMPTRQFFLWNVVGAILWVDGIVLLGYFLGDVVDENFPIDKYLVPGIAFIIFLSILPVLIEWIRTRRHKKNEPEDAHGEASLGSGTPPTF
ncbi:DedA family protein [Cryptosporangium aurantiacum]|uniref:Membrane-associated protein n=1 Tax=Cryptosporangium aurantiacum TaxID=134849 RepID=A0A1M7RDN1_9ACTN|nr:VTT domain-containing protein [Cryptosporangium aurantiacum]SHN44148.1 membrane-associated protein [Cryptosporangium aurantiacum]